VLVDAPSTSKLADVLVAVKKRSRWISSHVAAAHERMAHVLPREYVSGESLHYLGRRDRLKIIAQTDLDATARMRGTFIVVALSDRSSAKVKSILDAWYRQRARELFAQRQAAVCAPLRWIKQLPPTCGFHLVWTAPPIIA
jgi:predicted metal-dependent hydrolase